MQNWESRIDLGPEGEELVLGQDRGTARLIPQKGVLAKVVASTATYASPPYTFPTLFCTFRRRIFYLRAYHIYTYIII